MAKSIEEAFKKAGLSTESLRTEANTARPQSKPQSKRRPADADSMSPDKSFAEQMASDGVSRTAATSRRKPPPPASRGSFSPCQETDSASRRKRAAGNAIALPAGNQKKSFSRDMQDLNRELARLRGVYGSGSSDRAEVAKVQRSGSAIEIVGQVVLNPALDGGNEVGLSLTAHDYDGRATQIAVAGSESNEDDLAIGLDFGTSSVKVVIRDKVRGAVAVPFVNGGTVNPYILPSRVFEHNGTYQLDRGGMAYRDLKLSLLGNGTGERELVRATAFLALVIRHARGWFLSEKKDVYLHSRLNWELNLGLPAANYQEKGLVRRFRTLAIAAMNLASDRAKAIDRELAAEYCQLGRAEEQRDPASDSDARISTARELVEVVPEIAAQIYGFVQSTRFNDKAPNVYMMVDVGAGTVDASIFHVRKESKGRYGFVFYANSVEPNGVMNLHRERINWLGEQCSKVADSSAGLGKMMSLLAQPTDRLSAIPEAVGDYLQGTKLRFSSHLDDPDEKFFRRRYWYQVFGQTLNFVRGVKLRESQLMDLPFVIAGGGARMDYYRRLVRRINDNPNIRWAHLDQMHLDRADNFEAPGLRESDYDRLSVAYGLSFLRLGSYVRSQEVPDLPPSATPDHFDRFISKDQT